MQTDLCNLVLAVLVAAADSSFRGLARQPELSVLPVIFKKNYQVQTWKHGLGIAFHCFRSQLRIY